MGAEGANAQRGVEGVAIFVAHFVLGVEAGGAVVVLPFEAEATFAAGGTPVEHDVIADLDAGNGRSYLLYHTRPFMAQQKGETVCTIRAGFQPQIGMADTRG
jgi:hypothetical protein